jgi:hypothetical protein
VEIIDRLSKHYDPDVIQAAQIYYWTKEVKPGKTDLLTILPPETSPEMGLDDCIGRPLKEDPHLSAKTIAKAVRSHLNKSLEMKYYHMRRGLPH